MNDPESYWRRRREVVRDKAADAMVRMLNVSRDDADRLVDLLAEVAKCETMATMSRGAK